MPFYIYESMLTGGLYHTDDPIDWDEDDILVGTANNRKEAAQALLYYYTDGNSNPADMIWIEENFGELLDEWFAED